MHKGSIGGGNTCRLALNLSRLFVLEKALDTKAVGSQADHLHVTLVKVLSNEEEKERKVALFRSTPTKVDLCLWKKIK